MTGTLSNTFTKSERLCGKTSVASLIKQGRWGFSAHLRYCWKEREDGEGNRVLVSVPKKYFKRAVKRNLLKRRMRECYRTGKSVLEGCSYDIMFVYSSPEPADFASIREEMSGILEKIGK